MSWTNAAITAEGHALQAALVGTGKGLVFTRAASGAGLAAGTLEEQTAVTDERQALSLQPAQVLEGAKVRVRAVLVNTGLSDVYKRQRSTSACGAMGTLRTASAAPSTGLSCKGGTAWHRSMQTSIV